ncbi:hypothetical protein BH18ACT9_BH18ACT9_15920 [soil metagenome]
MSGPRKVLMHVGAPKTGTSYVQDVLFRHRQALAAGDILYPGDRFDAHFLAALDLLELNWGGLEKEAVGAWDRLASEVRDWPGTVIISHEILATATRPQVMRALTSLGEDVEVHVVLSARDLVRQIPAEWQENLKHRKVLSYRDFLDKVTDPQRKGPLASWFWGVQEVPDVLDRWGAALPPERVHLVTVPRPGAPRDLLWLRFASVLGLDPSTYTPVAERANLSLGAPETALIRHINERVNYGVLANEDYRRFVRELLVHNTLSQRSESPRLALPADVHAWAAELSESWIELLGTRGYDVVGDLAELRPEPPEVGAGAGAYADPDAPDEEALNDAAMAAIVTLLQESALLAASERSLGEALHTAERELEHERTRHWWYRFKRRLVHAADQNAVAALGLAAYRKVRGRSSRSA